MKQKSSEFTPAMKQKIGKFTYAMKQICIFVTGSYEKSVIYWK